jgi:hypothetical protein
MNPRRAPASPTFPATAPRARIARSLLCALAVSVLAACGTDADDAPPMPANVVATAGDGRVTLTWTGEPGAQYWVFWLPGTSVSFPGSASEPGYRSSIGGASPRVVLNLANGTTYAFAVASASSDQQIGEQSPSVTATPRLAGDTWVSGTPLGTGSVNGVAYNGSNLFVAVGDGGAIWSSADAKSWTPRTSGTASELRSVAFTAGRFVAVGANGAVVTSTDGTTWEARTSGVATTLNAVANFSDSFVAAGANGVVLTAGSDASTWTVAASGTTAALNGLAAANGVMVAAGAGGTLLVSTDTRTWRTAATGTTADLRGAGYGAGLFVVTGSSGTVLWSPDANTWAAAATPTTATLNAVASGSRFAAVGDGGVALLSSDGKTWTATASGTTARLAATTWGNATFSAVGASGSNLVAQ